ncbi:interleukin-17 receptor C isoform X1 [Hypomesus transpacificus]|uniref:interleukin-17 receptor C isoform X1 n=1 Tax=Hypomesus transpacificus TaxID=137520 RepID=UPI001F088218|nr:interleukin-17 receptor C isoform X1 [Hypomesus transpacificus]
MDHHVRLIYFLFPLICSITATRLEIIDPEPAQQCSKGLNDCSQKAAVVPFEEGPVNISRLDLKVFLCCTNRTDCKLCLRIQLYLSVQGQHMDEEVSGDHGEYRNLDELVGQGSSREVTGISTEVCYSFPNFQPRCTEVRFRCCHSALSEPFLFEMWLSFLARAKFGSPVLITLLNIASTITIPSLQEVCSSDLYVSVKECDVPKLQAVTDLRKGVALLQLDNSSMTQTKEMVMCQMFGTGVGGVCRKLNWHKDQREMAIPLTSIAPCLCFRVRWKGKELHNMVCPFLNHQEIFRRMRDNVSVSVVEAQTREGSVKALQWNLTAPCRLEGGLWLCRTDVVAGQCVEVEGSRQKLNNQSSDGWIATLYGHWKWGEFLNVMPDPALCVQVKVQGMDSDLEPVCPFARTRGRWTMPLLFGLLFICLSIPAAFVIQGVLKGYLWRWLEEDDIKGAVGGGHVVLLYLPDEDPALSGLVGRLGTSLKALGFSVSLDLWSQAELGVLGPVPWLHSRLDRLQRQGGKVILVLTKTSWDRAEDWGNWGWGRDSPKGMEEGEADGDCPSPSYSDVFSASFSCILADYLQGRAGERFALVQLESLPPQLAGGSRPLPELFRGLPLFSLPSQSLGFLTELAARGRGATVSGRRRRAGGLRAASRALAGGLRGFTGESAVFRLGGVSQDCVGTEVEDLWETVPLQPSLSLLSTPPSSPDTCSKNVGLDWV